MLKQGHTLLHSIPLVPETGQGMAAGDVGSWTDTTGLVWASVSARSRCLGSGVAILSRAGEHPPCPLPQESHTIAGLPTVWLAGSALVGWELLRSRYFPTARTQ